MRAGVFLCLFWLFLHLLDYGTKPAAHGISRLICNFQHAGIDIPPFQLLGGKNAAAKLLDLPPFCAR